MNFIGLSGSLGQPLLNILMAGLWDRWGIERVIGKFF
jgi:hypothetical protein